MYRRGLGNNWTTLFFAKGSYLDWYRTAVSATTTATSTTTTITSTSTPRVPVGEAVCQVERVLVEVCLDNERQGPKRFQACSSKLVLEVAGIRTGPVPSHAFLLRPRLNRATPTCRHVVFGNSAVQQRRIVFDMERYPGVSKCNCIKNIDYIPLLLGSLGFDGCFCLCYLKKTRRCKRKLLLLLLMMDGNELNVTRHLQVCEIKTKYSRAEHKQGLSRVRDFASTSSNP